MHQRVKMLKSHTLTEPGSATTLLEGHFYILDAAVAAALVAAGAAELDADWEE